VLVTGRLLIVWQIYEFKKIKFTGGKSYYFRSYVCFGRGVGYGTYRGVAWRWFELIFGILAPGFGESGADYREIATDLTP
jgi:hypothetical protein